MRKTALLVVLAAALSGCTAAQLQRAEQGLEARERHGIRAGVSVLTEGTMLGIDALQQLYEDTGQSLDSIRDKLGQPAATSTPQVIR